MSPINVTLVLFFYLITHQSFLSFIPGDPQAADRPAIIAVFKTRTSPVFELLPWFVLLCAVHICVVLVELKNIAFHSVILLLYILSVLEL